MKIHAWVMAAALSLLSPYLLAADDSAEVQAEAKCTAWAKEDGIQKDEMEEYMAECVAEQLAGAHEASSQN